MCLVSPYRADFNPVCCVAVLQLYSGRLSKMVAEMQIPEPLLTQGSHLRFEDLLSPEAHLMVSMCIALDSNF